MILRRSDLYRLVWSHPGVHVAKLLGVSSSALTKICRRAHVPSPERGHWRRLEVGQSVSKPALPEGADTPLRFVVSEELKRVLSELPLAAEIPSAPPPALPVIEPKPAQAIELDGDLRVDACQPLNGNAVRPKADAAPVRVGAFVGPTMEDLISLSQQHRVRQDVASLIHALDSVVASQPAPVAAVMSLWLVRARELMRMGAPVDRVVEACRLASWGDLPPSSQ